MNKRANLLSMKNLGAYEQTRKFTKYDKLRICLGMRNFGVYEHMHRFAESLKYLGAYEHAQAC